MCARVAFARVMCARVMCARVMCAPTARLLSAVSGGPLSLTRVLCVGGGGCWGRDGLGASSQSCCFLCNLLAPAAQGIRPAQTGPEPCRASSASLSLSPVLELALKFPSASSPNSPPTIHLSRWAVSSVNSPGPAPLPALPPGRGRAPGGATSGPGGASSASRCSLR